jgi:carbonic anhydrase
MRLFEAILEANQRAAIGEGKVSLRAEDFAQELPVVVVSCIDARLNALVPRALGLPEDQFIWLRNAGNIITGTMSSTMRSLALACAVKGGKEIAILGHTDCKVRRMSALDLLESFRKLGVERKQLPDNLNEFFGLFASERQNVLRGVEFVRQSPLIGPKVPVHGLLQDVQTGRLEWLVNGYQALEAVTAAGPARQAAPMESNPLAALPEFRIGELKFPEMKIGESASSMTSIIHPAAPAPALSQPLGQPASPEGAPATTPGQPHPPRAKFDPAAMFKVVAENQKIYGPVSGAEIEKWLAEDRITLQSLAQKLGYKEWQPLLTHLTGREPPKIPLPSSVKGALRMKPPWSRKTDR